VKWFVLFFLLPLTETCFLSIFPSAKPQSKEPELSNSDKTLCYAAYPSLYRDWRDGSCKNPRVMSTPAAGRIKTSNTGNNLRQEAGRRIANAAVTPGLVLSFDLRIQLCLNLDPLPSRNRCDRSLPYGGLVQAVFSKVYICRIFRKDL
jgi:hypothetical protein